MTAKTNFIKQYDGFRSMEERQQSEFNMAVSYLNRLNYLFYACDESAMSLDVYNWFHSLMALFRELSTEMKTGKDNNEIDKFNDIIKDINTLMTPALEKQGRNGKTEIQPDLYMKLHNFELELRKILKSAGLQSKMIDDAANALR